MVRKHLLAALIVATAGSLLPTSGQAEDQRVVNCPAGKSYCTAETRRSVVPQTDADVDSPRTTVSPGGARGVNPSRS